MLGRKRVAAALALAATVVVPSTASAAISDARATPTALAQAIANDPTTVTSATFTSIAPTGVPAGLSDVPLTTFPRNGSTYAILTTGDARFADDANIEGNLSDHLGFDFPPPPDPVRGTPAHDVLTMRIDLTVPPTANCLLMRFRFLSEEFPEFVGSSFNDGFVAELDTTNWSVAVGADGNPVIESLQNFAFDQNSNPITINATGASTVAAANATGTTYDAATRRLAAAKVATPGDHALYLSIFDMSDHIYDSAVFVDGLEFRNVEASKCTGGAFQDDAPPALNAGAPSSAPETLISQSGTFTQDDTPTFGGKAGTSLNDDPNVTGKIFAATTTRANPVAGTAIQQKSAAVTADGSWTITADKLPEGSYQFQASQTANNGETAFNDPIAFAVDRTGPKPSVLTALFGGKTRDATPLLNGAAGAAAGDGATLAVKVFSGAAATGNPVAQGTAQRSGAAWTLQVAQKLRDGAYTAVAEQADAAANLGVSGPLTFSVTTANPIGKVKFPKRFKRANVARKLAGSLKFDFPGSVTYKATAKIGTRTFTIGTVRRTLAAPGVAKFSLKPNRGLARRIRRGRGVITLQTTFVEVVDGQNRSYKRSQRVGFRR